MQNKKIILSVVVCVAIAVLSFWGGMSYGKSKVSTRGFGDRQGQFGQGRFDQNGGNRMMGQNNRGMVGGGFTTGDIISKDDKSVTIKLKDGGSKIVLVPQSVKVEKTVDGSLSDIIIGKSVMVTGATNTDGSINATSIQIRPVAPVNNPAQAN